MIAQRVFSGQSLTGRLLVLSSALMLVGVVLYSGRNIWQWPAGETASYLLWERGFFLAAIVVLVLGLRLLERILNIAGDTVLARLGLGAYLAGALLGITAELFEISTHASLYTLIVVYVVLAFLGQAAFGVSLLRTGLLPGWIGWATIGWNLGWLVVLPIVSPGDIYFPILHHVAPLLIGIALLVMR